ncbi:hypothetical protein L1049_024441 [Liquidambar formosana]|uniref:J domain-containing protein n=1 Tax=Liquidambar formosana TaxID=63359 RepID=A0AAP0RV99_LIQFO
MDMSLSSSLLNSKPFFSRPLANNSRRPPAFISITSCKATSMGSEKETTNFYKVLSLSPHNACDEEIKRAYRTMALRYHPDVCHPSMKEESTRKFVQLHAAYKTLSDPVAREEYDFQLGLNSSGRKSKMSFGDEGGMRNRWQDQIFELKRKSNRRKAQKDGSWGSRMRSQNRQKN